MTQVETHLANIAELTKQWKTALAPFRIPYSAWGIWAEVEDRRIDRKLYSGVVHVSPSVSEIAARYKRLYPCMVK